MSKVKTIPGHVNRPAVSTQVHMAQAEVHLKLWHLGQPWMGWIGLMGLSAILYKIFPGFGTVVATIGVGVVLAGVDRHLRSTRIHRIARWIGPGTILAATGWLTAVLVVGYPKAMFLAWLMGGILACVTWNIWMISGAHKDETRAFAGAAEAVGAGGTRLSGLRKGARGVLSGIMHLPGGRITPSEAADLVENWEGAHKHPPGSWTITPHPRHADQAIVRISDPEILNAGPLEWPGPSAVGETIGKPIRPALWQDGEEMWLSILNQHLRAIGSTGSGKSQGWVWNELAEVMSRCDTAIYAIDITKGNQFLGPLRPAMHGFETEPEGALKLLAAIHRAGKARGDYLASKHLTSWEPGCGLSFLDFTLEEIPDLVVLLEKGEPLPGYSKGQQFNEWKSDVRAYRSFGGRWLATMQNSTYKELPTLARGQMGTLCAGLLDAADAEYGLSEEQRKRGCRPQKWGIRYPGKFYIDTLSISDDRISMPARGWSWGENASLIRDYSLQFPWEDRPLDDVTGEAMEAAPGPSPTSALPYDGITGSGAAQPVAGRPNLHLATVRDLPAVKQPGRMTPDDRFEALQDEVDAMRRRGVEIFRIKDLTPLAKELGQSSQWLYGPLERMAENRTIEKIERVPGQGVTKWRILSQAEQETGE